MCIKTILFDLDGTLLPMDQDLFIKYYFGALAKKLIPYGYEKERLLAGIWKGTEAMVQNDGRVNNEAMFWQIFTRYCGEQAIQDMPVFEEFYRNEFIAAKQACGFNPQAAEVITQLKSMGYRLILATNPLFPSIATENRIAWAGLQKEDFELVTTYENSYHCKPNPVYYQDIVNSLDLKPEECLMVGNDVSEDMVASALGMKVFLLTDCILNREEKDISAYPNGGFPELMEYIHSL